ncbi:MAG: hypothetical protein LC679_07515 [Intrasporangiaceae bacterium]|nr:hypothetical protein [Intrasporangiaceae bacterium]
MNDTTAPTDTRTARIDGLRQLADLLEANPAIPAPETVHIWLWSMSNGDTDKVAALSTFARAMPGKVDKKIDEQDYKLTAHLDGLRVAIVANRKDVCVKQTVTKEVEEWVCPDSLLAYEGAVNGQVVA